MKKYTSHCGNSDRDMEILSSSEWSEEVMMTEWSPCLRLERVIPALSVWAEWKAETEISRNIFCPLQKITADPMKATGPSEKVMKFVNFWIRFVSVWFPCWILTAMRYANMDMVPYIIPSTDRCWKCRTGLWKSMNVMPGELICAEIFRLIIISGKEWIRSLPVRMRLVPWSAFFRNIQALVCLHSVIPEGRSFTADRRKALPTIRKITDWQGIYRNVPAIVWKKGLQVVRESKKPEQNLRWDLRNSFMRK